MAFERRTHTECLSELQKWVEAGTPFCSLRLTDGELIAMFRTREPTAVTADDNVMSEEIGDAIRDTIRGFAETLRIDENACIQFGTTMYQHPDKETKFLAGYAYSLGIHDKLRWINGHDMLDGVVDGSARRLMEAIRDSGKTVILMGDERIRDAARCLGALFFPVPKPNAWNHRDLVVERLVPFLQDDAGGEHQDPIIVWCCGMGMKPVAWKLWRSYPQSSHLDAGHIFDGAFGIMSREWLRNQESPWWTPYMGPGGFKEWVLSFIPK